MTAASSFAGEEDSVGTVYMMDILEEAGSDIARRSYWDFGRWSDLWRVWRPLGSSREASLSMPVRHCDPLSFYNFLGVEHLLHDGYHVTLSGG